MRIASSVCALTFCLIVPAAARADIAVQRLSLTPAATQAGANARVDLHAELSTEDPVRALALHLPPGLLGNPQAAPRCPQRRFAEGTCPRASRVGSARATTTLPLAGSLTGGVYNLEPGAGEPARLGIAISPAVPATAMRMTAAVALRPDGGLDAVIRDIPASPAPVRSLDLSLGDAFAPGFVRLPTSCEPARTTLEATAASGARGSASSVFTPTRCDLVPFAPALSATIDRRGPRGARSNPALRTVLIVPPGHAGVRRTRVALPPRLALDLSRRPATCAPEQAQADACPPASRIGALTAATPLLATPLSGSVHLTALPGSLLPGLRLSLDGAVRLRLAGAAEVLPSGINTTFDGMPDLPLGHLQLDFDGGGPLRVLGDPCQAQPLRVALALTGHNGATAGARARVRVAGCPPSVRARLTRGARPRLTVAIRRGRDAPRIRRVTLRLPSGLRANGRRTVVVRLRRPRAKVTVTLRRGAMRARRVRGSLRVTVTGAGGARSTMRLKAAELR